MRISLFVHMERLTADETTDSLYRDFLELCQIADDAGFHAIWSGEHHGMDFTIAPNPFLTLTDLCHRTKNVRLGTGTVVAPFWHPVKLAGEAAMTDIVTGGRLDIGIARGAYSFEYERLGGGMDAWTAGQHLREIVPAVKGLWNGNYAHDGECWSFPETTSCPKPRQDPHPPIWVAARDPNSFEFALQQECNVQVTPLWQGDEEVSSLMERYKTAQESAGGGKSTKIMLLRHTYTAADEEDVERAAEEINRYYNYFGAWFKNERPIDQGVIAPLSEEEISANPMFTPEKMRRDTVIGTPPEVIDRLKFCEDLGYDEYAIWIDSGMSFERKRESLRRFADHVLPVFH